MCTQRLHYVTSESTKEKKTRKTHMQAHKIKRENDVSG